MKTITELDSMADDMIVDELVAMVKSVKVYKPAVPTDQFPASKQGMVIADDYAEIWVNIKNHAEYGKNMEGKLIKLSSYLDKEKKTWFGVKKGSYEKDGKKHNTLNVTKTGKIAIVEGEPKLEEQPVEVKEGAKDAVKEPIKPVIEPTDWGKKERRDLRARMYNSALMTIYPIMSKEVLAEGQKHSQRQIFNEIEAFAKQGCNFVFEDDTEIEF